MRRALILIVAVGCLAACGGSGAGEGTLKIQFGREGGLIVPYAVTIAPGGAITTSGNPPAKPTPLTTAQDEALSQQVRAAMGNLHSVASCPHSFPDEAASFIKALGKTIYVRGTCEPAFTTLYDALSGTLGLNR